MEHHPICTPQHLTKTLAALLLLVIMLSSAGNALATPASTTATTLSVGPDRALKAPSEAARIARSGDTVEIDAGLYTNDYAVWHQDNLTLRAVGGMAHLEATVLIPNGKAIWIINGNNVSVENIEFSGARVKDTNGAGIRHESGNLTLRNTFFHRNEFSILTGGDNTSSLVIEDSRFWYQRRPGRFSHGMYIGALKKFSLSGSHIMGTDRGHQIKTRALENHIMYNRIEDIPGGNSSRLIDFSNCGRSFVIGNDMHQTTTTHNIDAIGYGAEGCEGRSAMQKQLYVSHNTFINEAWNGALVRNHVGGDVLVVNNLSFGRGRFLLGKGSKSNNIGVNLNRWQRGSWLPPADSSAVDSAKILPHVDGISMQPARVFSPPTGTIERKIIGNLDVGAREYVLKNAAAR